MAALRNKAELTSEGKVGVNQTNRWGRCRGTRVKENMEVQETECQYIEILII